MLLFLLIRLRNPKARVVFVTSLPVPQTILDYYLHFLAGIPASHAAARLRLFSVYDGSPRSLSEKLLERPRLIERIRASLPDPSRAYLTVLRATALERRLAVALDVPLNAADPEQEADFASKSGGRRLLREAGLEVPPGREGLRDEKDAIEAIQDLRRERPHMRRALLKLETSFWDQGHALLDLPEADSREELRAALRRLRLSTPRISSEDYLERLSRKGGVVEEFMSARECRDASAQVRINPLGQVFPTATHDELRGGAWGLSSHGCLFPADGEYRARLQQAAVRVGKLLAGRGLTSRVSVEFLLLRDEHRDDWRMLGREINLGVGGATHPLLAVRFLCGGELDPGTGLFLAPSGRSKFYRCTDELRSEAYLGLVPDDLIEVLTLQRLNYSPQSEQGALFYMLGAISELGRVGMLAIGSSREEADTVYRHTVATLDRECGPRRR